MCRLTTPAVLLTLAALLSAAGPATKPAGQPTSAPAAISWDKAAKHVGETVTVTGPVKGTHLSGKNVALNVGKDYPAADRFAIYLPFDGTAKAADDQYLNKTVTVTGKVVKYKDIVEIRAGQASDVTVTDPDKK